MAVAPNLSNKANTKKEEMFTTFKREKCLSILTSDKKMKTQFLFAPLKHDQTPKLSSSRFLVKELANLAK